MIKAVGLRTYIWNNNLKSILLLAGFPLLLCLLLYAGILIFGAVAGGSGPAYKGQAVGLAFGEAARQLPVVLPFALIGAGLWFIVAWFGHQAMIDSMTGARKVSRSEEAELYNLLENLCISRGITMPDLRVIETGARNAYASGLKQGQYSITVTRGLMETLERDEIEAVLAHELSHIRHNDVRLLVISVIFAGIISVVAEIMARGRLHGSLNRVGGARRGKGGNAIVIVLIGVAIVAVAYALAVVIRFALSRRREFMADAGAVELTKNPDAMIRALQKISADPKIEKAPREVREMFLYDHETGFAGLFATHPPIDKRIAALVEYGGGRAGEAPV